MPSSQCVLYGLKMFKISLLYAIMISSCQKHRFQVCLLKCDGISSVKDFDRIPLAVNEIPFSLFFKLTKPQSWKSLRLTQTKQQYSNLSSKQTRRQLFVFHQDLGVLAFFSVWESPAFSAQSSRNQVDEICMPSRNRQVSYKREVGEVGRQQQGWRLATVT